MRRPIRLLLALLIWSGPAFAQAITDPRVALLVSQVQAELARLAPLSALSAPGAAGPVNDILNRARGLFAQANSALARALTSNNAGATAAELASILSQLTPLEADQARVTSLLLDTSYVTRLIVDAGRELDRARQTLAAVPSARAETLFSLAQDALAEARQLQRSGQLAEARQLAERSARLSLDLQHLTADRDELRRRIEHVLREIDHLIDLTPPSPKAPLRLKLQETDRFARAAREAYLADARGDCLSQLFEAEKLLKQADDLATGKHGPTPFQERAHADERLKAASHTITQVSRSLGQSPPPLAVRTLAAARRYQLRAEDYFARGLYESAGANAHLAQRLANRAGTLRR